MLEHFRNASKSWFFKIFFALLVLSFVSWGVGDVVRGGFGQNSAIEIGDVHLSASEVEAEFRREVERLQPLFGGKLTPDDARKLGMMDRTVDTLVTRTLVDEAGRVLGLATTDDVVLKAIAANPQLRNEQGQFDRDLLRRLIISAGMNEDQFLRAERANLVRSQMAEALSGGIVAPAALVEPLSRYRSERRVAEAVEIRVDSLPPPAAPADEAVLAHYQDNQARFMAPERRSFTFLAIRPADVAQTLVVTDEQIAESYRQRLAEFSTPERRHLSQIVLADEIQVAKAAEMVTQGKGLADVAQQVGGEIVDLGEVEKIDLPDELADTVFAVAQGATTPPTKTSFGWHVVKVGAIRPGKVRSLAEVRGELAEDMKRERSLDALAELANKVEDALGGGASLEEAAKNHGLETIRFEDIDSKGRGPDGRPAARLPKGETPIDVAFRIDQGNESGLTDLDGGGYFLLRVDAVTVPAPRPLADVRAEVVASLQASRRIEAALARAEQVADKVRMGESLAAAGRPFGLSPVTTRAFGRDGAEARPLPNTLVSDMFKAAPGDVALAEGGGGVVVARLLRVVVPETRDARALAEEGRRVATAVSGDLLGQYLAALRADLGVKVDRKQLVRDE